ncbi:hypothetical protein [Sphingomonas sp. PAMC 26605]|uniref:hypothetical protein n=1 Tax=Sphingomonas sp. PAMC 26605 TaxID=1112214 RepID=UPI00026CCFC4|nr:hypothetical protein [Sphingomonas sp. PAMC 26605]
MICAPLPSALSTRHRSTILALGTIALATATPVTAAHADALQTRIVAAARATPTMRHAFRRTLAFERTGAPRKTYVEQFDPSRPAAERWSLISIDGRAPTPKDIATSRKANHGPIPSYAELAKWFGSPATRTDDGGGVLYRFARLPAGTFKIGSHDASADTQVEALVNTSGAVPFVERVRMTSNKSFSVMLVASLRSITVDQRYRVLADGTAVPSDATSALTGAMMGKAGTMRTATSYSEFRAIP